MVPSKTMTSTKRMALYRQRMRAAGLRQAQIWVPDARAAEFVETCRRQARAVAAGDPAGDEIMRVIADIRERPKS